MEASAWIIVLTSAAVAALVSAAATLFGQFLERRAQRRHLLLEKATDFAKMRTEFAWRVAEHGNNVTMWDPLALTAEYYKILNHLYDEGDLPADIRKKHDESIGKATIRKP